MSWKSALRRLPLLLAPALLALALGEANAQQAPATLSLEEAIALARRYNTDYRIQANDQSVADWAVAESFASILPSVSLNSSYQYQAPGTPRIGLFSAEELGISRTPSYYFSNYGVNLFTQISANTFFNISQQRANRTATDARVAAAGYTLSADVTRDYLTAMRARDQVVAARQDLETARESKKLADARVAGGADAPLAAAQAEVAAGRAEVALVQAENTFEADKLRLLQRIGLTLDRDVELSTTFNVFDPTWTRADLMRMALDNHPQLVSSRAAEDASIAASRAAKFAYLPSLNLNANWSGSAREVGDRSSVINSARNSVNNQRSNCEFNNKLASVFGEALDDCSRFVFTSEREAAALAANNLFPFNFTENPASLSVSVSIPIFNGLTRERNMQQARADAEDARQRRRAAELNQQTMVATAHANAMAARKLVDIEQRNVQAADLSLNLARERYRLGGGVFMDLALAQQAKAQADRAYLAALYSFHENIAALESAVGQSLRQRE